MSNLTLSIRYDIHRKFRYDMTYRKNRYDMIISKNSIRYDVSKSSIRYFDVLLYICIAIFGTISNTTIILVVGLHPCCPLLLTGREGDDEDDHEGDERDAVLRCSSQRANLSRLQDRPLTPPKKPIYRKKGTYEILYIERRGQNQRISERASERESEQAK